MNQLKRLSKINTDTKDEKVHICEKCGKKSDKLFLVDSTHFVCYSCKIKTI